MEDRLAPPCRYKALLLDMNGTFMFGEDRFGHAERYYPVYRAVGGSRLAEAHVEEAVRSAYQVMLAAYSDPGRVDNFPTLAETLREQLSVASDELVFLERVFEVHEMGRVPPAFAACLKRLSSSYELGIVSNIWARRDVWLRHFAEVAILDLWKTCVFSSDTRSIKPSPVLFQRAIAELGVEPGDVLFIGDSLRSDILPAKALGMPTAWVGEAAEPHPSADWTAASLLELELALDVAP